MGITLAGGISLIRLVTLAGLIALRLGLCRRLVISLPCRTVLVLVLRVSFHYFFPFREPRSSVILSGREVTEAYDNSIYNFIIPAQSCKLFFLSLTPLFAL